MGVSSFDEREREMIQHIQNIQSVQSVQSVQHVQYMETTADVIWFRLAIWFFIISLFANLSSLFFGRMKSGGRSGGRRGQGRMSFDINWFSFVFPNSALVTATFAVGKAFRVRSIQRLGLVLAVVLLVVWFSVVGFLLRALWLRDVLWSNDDDDDGDIDDVDGHGHGLARVRADDEDGMRGHRTTTENLA